MTETESKPALWRIMTMAFFACSIIAGCGGEIDFDEEAWRAEVLSRDRTLLYAPNYIPGEGFVNPWMPTRVKKGGFWAFRMSPNIPVPADFDERKYSAVPNNLEYLAGKENTLTFAGHASFIIRMDNSTILTDPYFSGRALIVFDRVKRNINFDNIPLRPVVLISHNHYDHMDAWSIRKLVDRQAVFIVPLGLKNLMMLYGAEEIFELDWWQDVTVNNVRYTLLPAQHWSRRIGQSANSTLWGSFMIEGSKRIYFSGDTGYFVGFREFGERFPKIDYALLGAGANSPRWLMHYAHLDVKEFFAAAEDIGAKVAIPMHFGVIDLGKEPLLHPPYEMEKFVEKNPEWQERARIMRVGEYFVMED